MNDFGKVDAPPGYDFVSAEAASLSARSVARGTREWVWLVPMAAVVALACAIAFVFGRGVVPSNTIVRYGATGLWFGPALLSVAVVEILRQSLLKGRPGFLIALSMLVRRFSSWINVVATLAPIALLIALSAAAGVMKMLLAVYSPFVWDSVFARADEILFLGHQPWQLTHALFGAMWPTLVIDRIYTFWIYLLPIAISAVALLAPRYDRARFFLSYALIIFLVGIDAAYAFSSAGPCFAPMISEPLATTFAPLMDRLHALSKTEVLWAVEWQGMLWNGHKYGWFDVGMGISAMPSVHVAVAVLYALTLTQFGRYFSWAAWTFAAIILIGSVHLGWHYAVDGLAAGIATLVIWLVVSKYLLLMGYSPQTVESAQVHSAVR